MTDNRVLLVPQMVDQPYWAGWVADLGIGAAHDGPTPTTESLSAALRTALTSETRARAKAVAGTIRTDGATGRRGDGGSDAATRRGQPRKVTSVRVNHGIVEPGKAPGAGLHRQLGMLEETGILGGSARAE